jgi:hypothetical protein
MKYPVKSSRGVYYDLSVSPYEFKGLYGDIFKFSSSKKLEIYTREHAKRLEQLKRCNEKINQLTGRNIKIHELEYRDLEKILYEEVMR